MYTYANENELYVDGKLVSGNFTIFLTTLFFCFSQTLMNFENTKNGVYSLRFPLVCFSNKIFFFLTEGNEIA